MQSLLVCEPRRKPSVSTNLARHLPTMLRLIEHEWKAGAWALRPDRHEHALLRSIHLSLGELVDACEENSAR